jgi:hypothetical protein
MCNNETRKEGKKWGYKNGMGGGKTPGPILVTGLVTSYGATARRDVMDLSVSQGLFGPLKKHLAGKRFATDADVRQAVNS